MKNLLILLIFTLSLKINAQKTYNFENKYYFKNKTYLNKEFYSKINIKHKIRVIGDNVFYLQDISIYENYDQFIFVARYRDKYKKLYNLILSYEAKDKKYCLQHRGCRGHSND